MRVGNRYSIPPSLFELIRSDDYSKGAARISVTELIDSPRIRVLRETHDAALEQDAMDRVWMMLGRALHELAARIQVASIISEERLFARVRGWVISGAIDVQHQLPDGSVAIYDYKLTSARIVQSYAQDKIEWERQLNLYAWLVEAVKHRRVSQLEIIAILRDWSRQNAIRQKDYPQVPIVKIPIRSWTGLERFAYLSERVRLHQQAERARMLGQRLPYCTDQEMWMRGAHWRVAVPEAKRAISKCDTEEQALEVQQTHPGTEITYIRGTPVRCVSWCLVRDFCDQYQQQQVFPMDPPDEEKGEQPHESRVSGTAAG